MGSEMCIRDRVAHMGREPGITLSRDDASVGLNQWAGELLTTMQGVAQVLDRAHDSSTYSESLERQLACVTDPEETTSARMLQDMRDNNEGFFHFAKRMSHQHYNYFNSMRLSKSQQDVFEQAAEKSIEQQLQIEAENSISFDEYLKRYFAQ